MKRTLIAIFAAPVLFSGCGSSDRTEPQQQEASDAPVMIEERQAENTLALTEGQLIGANLLDLRGNNIGRIRGVLRGDDGQITALDVEIDDSALPDRVLLPLDGLEAIQVGERWNIRSNLTRERLVNMLDAAH
jgi:uncharacterized protein YceK